MSQTPLLHNDQGYEAHRKNIVTFSKHLIDTTKQIAALEKSSQIHDQNEKQIISIIEDSETGLLFACDKLVENVKYAAATLSSDYKDIQSLLLQSFISVLDKILDLVNSINSKEDDYKQIRISAAKGVILSIMGALKTINEIEEEFSRGIREFDATVKKLDEQVEEDMLEEKIIEYEAVYDPQELLKCMKSFSSATTKMIAIGRHPKNEDLLLCSEETEYWIFTLIKIILGTALSTDNIEIRNDLLIQGKETSKAYLTLCSKIIEIASTNDKITADKLKLQLNTQSKDIANGVKSIVNIAERLKNPDDYIDPNNPNDVAEMQLRSAAAKIEAAAAKLAQLQPRPKENIDIEDLTFDEVILEAARSIAGATQALVKSAQVAQKELIVQGRMNTNRDTDKEVYYEGQWTDGLISAAQQVAHSTGNLCEAANETVQGNAAQEKLIVSAKTVSANTTTLVMACQVKSDIDSKALLGLKEASSQVKNATNQLVTTAQEFLNKEKELEEQQTLNSTSRLMSEGGKNDDFKNELKLKEEIERTQRQLEEQYRQLKMTRNMRYSKQRESEAAQ